MEPRRLDYEDIDRALTFSTVDLIREARGFFLQLNEPITPFVVVWKVKNPGLGDMYWDYRGALSLEEAKRVRDDVDGVIMRRRLYWTVQDVDGVVR
jgi:hypothetical protein